MSNIGVKGEQSTSTEIAMLTALTNLAAGGANTAIQKTGTTTVANVTVSASGSTVAYTIVATSSNYTATQTSGLIYILVDASGGARTITLPSATGNGTLFSIKKTDSSTNTVTVSGAGATIDGGTTAVIRAQYAAMEIVTDGTSWYVV